MNRLLVIAGLAVLPLSALAQEAPPFKAPFGCAQSWDASTYDTHGFGVDDPDMIDFKYWKDRTRKSEPETQNLTLGQAIRASAAGVVERDDLFPDDENGLVRRLRIKHNDDWTTVHLHSRIDPVLLEVGRKVAIGEVIAYAGRSGTGFNNAHIHYVQSENDEARRVTFDGVPLATHAGDSSTWGLDASDQAERVVSSNCTGNEFARWRSGGDDYILRYQPNTGRVRITRMEADASAGTHTWSSGDGAWGRNWTHIVPYRAGGVQHILRYSARSGRATFYEVEAGGAGLNKVADTTTWRPGWTLLRRIEHDGDSYVFAYDSISGYNEILLVSSGGDHVSIKHAHYDAKGWTHVLGFDEGDSQYLLYYKAATGRIEIRRMDLVVGSSAGATRIELTPVYEGDRSPGWTHLVLARSGGELYMVGYRATNGRTAIWRIASSRSGPSRVAQFNLSRKWDIVTTLPNGGNPRIMFYGVDRGDMRVFALEADGAGLDGFDTADWQGGWR